MLPKAVSFELSWLTRQTISHPLWTLLVTTQNYQRPWCKGLYVAVDEVKDTVAVDEVKDTVALAVEEALKKFSMPASGK